jgi:hypothetical protein
MCSSPETGSMQSSALSSWIAKHCHRTAYQKGQGLGINAVTQKIPQHSIKSPSNNHRCRSYENLPFILNLCMLLLLPGIFINDTLLD